MFRRTCIACLAVAGLVGPARAGLIPASVTVTPEAGNFRWTYAVVLPTDMKLQSGDYFTVYDFGGLVPGTQFADPQNSAAADWVMSVSADGPTPAGLNASDDPGVDNLVFRYQGGGIPLGQLGLGNFGAASSVGTSTVTDFAAQNPQASTGDQDRNIVNTIAPGVPPAVDPTPGVPEPTTLVLAGLGLPLVGARLWRKKK